MNGDDSRSLDANPYAAPKEDSRLASVADCRRDGKTLIVRIGSDLPPRCIYCNDDVMGTIKPRVFASDVPVIIFIVLGTQLVKHRRLWPESWLFFLALGCLVACALMFISSRRKIVVSPAVCPRHQTARKSRLRILISAGVVLLGIAYTLFVVDQFGAGVGFAALSIVAFACAAAAGRTLYLRKLTKKEARFGGCKEPFLASLES